MIRADRGRYVVAALTIIRAFTTAENPHQATPINGYHQYCAMVRDPLLWLGCADPCSTMEEVHQHDSRLVTRYQIAAQWRAVFDDQQFTTVEVIERASMRGHYEDDRLIYPEFHTVFLEVTGFDPNRRGRP
jgi:putative DNA primase/helicase